MKSLFFILCALYCYSSQALYIVLHSNDLSKTNFNYIADYIFEYNIDNFLPQEFAQQNKILHQLLGENPNQKDMLKLIKKAKKKTKEALAYLFLEKWLMKEILDASGGGYFKNIPWDLKIKKKIYNLFWKNGASPYAYFIESLKNYVIMRNTNEPSKKAQFMNNFLALLRKSKAQGISSFDFMWAFTVLDLFYSNPANTAYSWTEDVRLAKQILLKLNREKYMSALYLSAFIKIKENQYQEALSHLKTLYKLDKSSKVVPILGLLYQYYFKDQKIAQEFSKKAIDIFNDEMAYLRPALLDSYLSTNDYSSGLQIAQDMINDNNQYPINYIMEISLFISSIFYKGMGNIKKDPFKARVWLEISRSIVTNVEKTVNKTEGGIQELLNRQYQIMSLLLRPIQQEDLNPVLEIPEIQITNDIILEPYMLQSIESSKEKGLKNLDGILADVSPEFIEILNEEEFKKLEILKEQIRENEQQKSQLFELANFIQNYKLRINYEEHTRTEPPILTKKQAQKAKKQARKQYEFLFVLNECQKVFH